MPSWSGTAFDAREIDDNLVVGTIKGSHSLSPAGAATYAIPLNLPAGINGLQPSVSLSYSSQSGDGLLGVGWTLGGLSSISRVGTDILHEGVREGVQADKQDRFSLDGNRLVLDDPQATYGDNLVTYSTESETFSRITSYTTSGIPGPAWFKVETKSGLTYEYGNHSSGIYQQNNQPNGAVLSWMLTKVYDPFGNYMTFVYDKSSNCPRIQLITYTGFGANTGMHTVEFQYLQRSDNVSQYHAKTQFDQQYLLTSIEVKTKATNNYWHLYRKYDLGYAFDGVQSFLAEITETGKNNARYNSTIFKYGEGGNTIETEKSTLTQSLPLEYGQHAVGDFNGDGYSDIVSFTGPNISANGFDNLPAVNKFQIYLRSKSSQDFQLSYTQNLANNVSIVNNQQYPNPRLQQIGDFNGDGIDDILTVQLTTNGSGVSTLHLVQIHYISIDNNGNIVVNSQPYFYPNSSQSIPVDISLGFIRIGDFDGDGRSDFAILSDFMYSNIQKPISVHFPALGTAGLLHYSSGNPYNGASEEVLVADINGNGKDELVLINQGFTGITRFLEVGTSQTGGYQAKLIAENTAINSKNQKIYPADFNADGNVDFLVGTKTNQPNTVQYNWAILVSKQDGFASENVAFNNNPDFTPNGNGDVNVWVEVGDLNADGQSDIVCAFMNNANTPVYHIYSRNKTNTFKFEVVNTYSGFGVVQDGYVGMGDFNGDGRLDIHLFQKNVPLIASGLDISYFRPHTTPLLIEKIKDGFNRTVEFKYNTLSKPGNYIAGSGATYPYMDFAKPINVLAKTIVPDGIGATVTETYTYKAAKIHLTGRGFMGFMEVGEDNPTTNIRKTTKFRLETAHHTVVPRKTLIYDLTSNQLLSESESDFDVLTLNGNRFWARPVYTHTLDHTGKEVNTTLSYDTYGNITEEVVEVVGHQTTTTQHDYPSQALTGAWIPSKPTATYVSKSTGFVNTHTFSWDAATGALLQEVEFAGQPLAVTTTYTYHSTGLPYFIQRSASGVASRWTDIGYDQDYYMVTHITNSTGQTEYIQNHVLWQKPTQKSDIAGNITQYRYDDMGRLSLTEEKAFTNDAFVVEHSQHWSIGNNSLYYTLTDHPGAPNLKRWYDVLERPFKTQTENPNGGWTETIKSFDARGNTIQETEPYFVGASPNVVRTYHYDGLNRLYLHYHSALAQPTYYTYAYQGGTTTLSVIDFAGRTHVKTTDALGRVASTTDPGGTLVFSYPNDFVKQTWMAGKKLTEVVWDDYGRQTQLVDANAGTTCYEYNAFGELTTQTDANGNITTMAYDNLGRITQRTGAEGTTNYDYYKYGDYASGSSFYPGINQVKTIVDFNGNTTDYSYDRYGNVIQSIKQIAGNGTYVSDYAYDNFGNLTHQTYPSGLHVQRDYDNNGYLLAVQDLTNNVNIFQAGNRNAAGQFTVYTLADQNLTRQLSYDDFARPTELKAFETTNPNLLYQQLGLAYDNPTGNLLMRTDYVKGLSESFSFDNLDRLTESSINGLSPLYVTYMPNGNINSKTDAGVGYIYSANQHNAVVDISFPNSGTNISLHTQNIAYTPYHQPETIDEDGYHLLLSYGHDYERVQTQLTHNTLTGIPLLHYTRTFLGDYEKNESFGGALQEIHYIGGGDGLAAIVVLENGSYNHYYVLTDHLGSILTAIKSGSVVAEQNFDAWGRRRNPDTWDYANLPTLPDWLYRGYTGHEHLEFFDLINMNGRLYDPTIGRMLSPDNYIQDPENTQSYNRYSYVWNNPMKYNDPSGEWVHIAIGAVVGGVANLGYQYFSGNVKDGWDAAAAFGIGLAAGAVGAATGNMMASALILGGTTGGAAAGALVGMVGGASSGLIQGVGNSLYFQRHEPDRLGNALRGGLTGMAAGAVTGMVMGGITGAIFTPKGYNRLTGLPKDRPAVNPVGKTGVVVKGGSTGADDEQYGVLGKIEDILGLKGKNGVVKDFGVDEGGVGYGNMTDTEIIGAKVTPHLQQFSGKTINDATAYAMRTQNNIDHIFASKHNLTPLVEKFGGQENTIHAVLRAANGKFPSNGGFKFPVDIGGQNVWIKGVIQGGLPKLSTMWIP